MEHQVQEIDLAGGSKLLIINLPVAVSFALNIYVRSGYRFVKLSQYELPHLLEHLAFEGNERYPDALAFKAEVEKDGTYFNAFTNTDYNYYQFISLPGELERIVNLGLAQVFLPILKPKSIAHEKVTVSHELKRNMDNFQRLRFYVTDQTLYGKQLPDWSERIKAMDTISSADLKQFHEANYQPQNIRFVISGKFTAAEVKAVVEQINQVLVGYPSGAANSYEPMQLEKFERKVTTRHIPLENQALFFLKFVRPGFDEAVLPALNVLDAIYNGGMSSRMAIKARQLGLTYGYGSGWGSDIDETSLYAYDQTDPAKLKGLFELGINELLDLAGGDYTDAELERAIGFEAGSLRRSHQTPASYASWYGGDFIVDRHLISPEIRINQILDVDRAAIAKAAKQYITADNWTLTLLGQKLDGAAEEFTGLIDKAFKQ